MISGVYAIINTVNEKVYIGSTTNFERRWEDHKCGLRKGIHYNPYLQRSWNKYGEGLFKFIILEYVGDPKNLVGIEQFWLDIYREEGKDLYNIALTAECPMRGRKHTEESRCKMRKASTGKTHSEETRRKMSRAKAGNQYSLGYRHSKETKQKIGKASKGRRYGPMSEETKQKLREVNLGKKLSEETRCKMSEAAMGNKNSLGRVVSDETRRKLSESGKKAWIKRRANMGEV